MWRAHRIAPPAPPRRCRSEVGHGASPLPATGWSSLRATRFEWRRPWRLAPGVGLRCSWGGCATTGIRLGDGEGCLVGAHLDDARPPPTRRRPGIGRLLWSGPGRPMERHRPPRRDHRCGLRQLRPARATRALVDCGPLHRRPAQRSRRRGIRVCHQRPVGDGRPWVDPGGRPQLSLGGWTRDHTGGSATGSGARATSSRSARSRWRIQLCVWRGIAPGAYRPRPRRTTRPRRSSQRRASDTVLDGRPSSRKPCRPTASTRSPIVDSPASKRCRVRR